MYSHQCSAEKQHLDKFNNKEEEYQDHSQQENIKTIESQSSPETLLSQFENYITRTDIIDRVQLNSSKYLKLKKYKDAAYYGEVVNGKRHGKGFIIHSNNHVYQGEWQCDFKYGKGYEEFSNGCIYHGYYVNGRPEGIGRYTWVNGEYYEGQWLNGLKHGFGKWNGVKGDSYVGEWKYGKADGNGVHVWINGDIYEGQFKQCLKHGEGIQKYVSGDIYKGSFYKGKFHGYGQYFWTNGSFYKGSFRNGCRQGNGIWKKSSGSSDKYQGQYYNDKKDGYGIYTWYNGNIYKGNYSQDSREGYGEMYWTDGSYYKGGWKNSQQEGEGIFYTPKGGKKMGIFKNNVMEEIYQQKVINTINEEAQFKKPRSKSKSALNSKRYASATNRRSNPTSLSETKPKKASIKIQDHNYNSISKGFPCNEDKKRQQNSKNRAPQIHKNVDCKNEGGRCKYTLEIESKQLSPIKQIKKSQIPHSAACRYKIQKRLKAVSRSANNRQGVRNSLMSNRLNSILCPLTPTTVRPFSTNHYGNL